MHRISTVLMVALLSLPGFGLLGADEVPGPRAAQPSLEKPGVLETARTYLETLYRFDWDAVAPLLAEDAVFEDPTSAFFGSEPFRLEGREAILSFFKSSSPGIEASFEVLRSFSTGEYVVFEVVYKTKGDAAALGYPGIRMKLEVAGTTILQVRHEKVIHHLDHVDYESLMRQMREQAGEEVK